MRPPGSRRPPIVVACPYSSHCCSTAEALVVRALSACCNTLQFPIIRRRKKADRSQAKERFEPVTRHLQCRVDGWPTVRRRGRQPGRSAGGPEPTVLFDRRFNGDPGDVPGRYEAQTASGTQRVWMLSRNCALSPRQVGAFYLSLVTATGVIAIVFLLRGAWMILPFSIVEMTALGIALLVYARHAVDCERVSLRVGRPRDRVDRRQPAQRDADRSACGASRDGSATAQQSRGGGPR